MSSGAQISSSLLLSYPRYILQPQGLFLPQDGSYRYYSQEKEEAPRTNGYMTGSTPSIEDFGKKPTQQLSLCGKNSLLFLVFLLFSYTATTLTTLLT